MASFSTTSSPRSCTLAPSPKSISALLCPNGLAMLRNGGDSNVIGNLGGVWVLELTKRLFSKSFDICRTVIGGSLGRGGDGRGDTNLDMSRTLDGDQVFG